MKILYRPHCGGLAEAMAEVKEFSTLKEMFEYIVKEAEELHDRAPFGIDDLSIRYCGYDRRIDWDTCLVCTDKMFKQNYQTSQAIGFCAFKE